MPEVPSCNSKAGRTDGAEWARLFGAPSIGVQGTSSSEMNVGDNSVFPPIFLSISTNSASNKSDGKVHAEKVLPRYAFPIRLIEKLKQGFALGGSETRKLLCWESTRCHRVGCAYLSREG